MQWLHSFLILTTVTAAPVKTAPPNLIMLKEAVELAVRADPVLRQTDEKVREASAQGWLAVSAALPEFDGTLKYQRKKDSVLNGKALFSGDAYNSYEATIKAKQALLVRGFFSGIFAGRGLKPIKALEFEIAERKVIFDTLQLFFKILLTTKNLETYKKALSIHEQSLEEAQHRLKIGRGQRLDVLQSKTEIALLAPKVTKTANDLQAAIAEFAKQIGKQNEIDPQLKGELKVPTLEELKKRLADVPSKIPEIEKARLELESLRDQNVVTLGKHWPRVDFEGSFGRNGYRKNDLTDGDANVWSAGITLSVPIFSGLSYWSERRALGAKEAQSSFEEIRVRQEMALSQVKARENLDTADSVIKSSKVAWELAEEALKEARKNYRVANIDYLQLLSTEQKLIDSELAFDQAKYDFITALTKYFTSNGFSPGILVDALGG